MSVCLCAPPPNTVLNLLSKLSHVLLPKTGSLQDPTWSASDASAAPHAGFPVRLTSYRNLTELEEETTDLGWVGAANPTISCLWYNKPRLWYSRERRRRLLPRSLPPPTRICVISRALSSQSRWLTVKGLKKKPKKLNKNKI